VSALLFIGGISLYVFPRKPKDAMSKIPLLLKHTQFTFGNKIAIGGYNWYVVNVDSSNKTAIVLCETVVKRKAYPDVWNYLRNEFSTDLKKKMECPEDVNVSDAIDLLSKADFEKLIKNPSLRSEFWNIEKNDSTKIGYWWLKRDHDNDYVSNVAKGDEFGSLSSGESGIRPVLRIQF